MPRADGHDASSPMTAAAEAATPAAAPSPLDQAPPSPLRRRASAGRFWPITTSGIGAVTVGTSRVASSSQLAMTWSRSRAGACAGARLASSLGSLPFSNALMRSSRGSVVPRMRMSRTARSSRARAVSTSCAAVSGATPSSRAMSGISSHSPAQSTRASRCSEGRPAATRSSGSGSANIMPPRAVDATRSAQTVRAREYSHSTPSPRGGRWTAAVNVSPSAASASRSPTRDQQYA
ncbi:hypothetical protein BJF79_11105 [Actinomadura sp. CNU-125]|uniref:hypothetical protein n=1 Tax=Actinomadura sp. CNU-125 TaxID=1904961 RepID=UPI00095DA699|nr:hypothetical protein [Actinomadura sp. CNU-125]OLT28368.1 hypothetical protein BJF79_11105 [Actinomadura sp. CNU-125]